MKKLLSATALFLIASMTINAQIKTFLQLDNIKGESAQADHKEWIDVISFQQGMNNNSTAATGSGAGAGKAVFQDLKIVKNIDRSTPSLFSSAANGRHIASASLDLVSNGKSIYVITLTDIVITSVTNSSQNDSNTEEIHIAYGKISWEYKGDNFSSKEGWDLKGNRGF